MSVSAVLRRLLHLRHLEEEQQKIVLDTALAELHRIEQALGRARAGERSGRQRIQLSAETGDPGDRIAGIVESESAQRNGALLERRIAAARQCAAELRDAYLAKRVERQQVETMIREREMLDAVEDQRRTQQSMDDWFAARRHAAGARAQSSPSRTAPRQLPANHEIKNHQESGVVPEPEPRSNR